MRALIVAFATVLITTVTLFIFTIRERAVTGDEFRKLVEGSGATSLGAWVLYYEDASKYCFRHPGPVVTAILRVEGKSGGAQFRLGNSKNGADV
jgi:hypothetical protein